MMVKEMTGWVGDWIFIFPIARVSLTCLLASLLTQAATKFVGIHHPPSLSLSLSLTLYGKQSLLPSFLVLDLSVAKGPNASARH